MAEKAAIKRRRLFDLYSRHIMLYEPDKQGIFVCPLCMRAFNDEALAPNAFSGLNC
jgi:hypothetical protein